jgi:hypothetical protein
MLTETRNALDSYLPGCDTVSGCVTPDISKHHAALIVSGEAAHKVHSLTLLNQ